jgi:hypothetical protein
LSRGDAVYFDAAQGFARRQTRLWIIVELVARDDVRVPSRCGEMKRQAAHDLAGRGMIGKEEAIEEDDALHLAVSARRNVGRWRNASVAADRAMMGSIVATDACDLKERSEHAACAGTVMRALL